MFSWKNDFLYSNIFGKKHVTEMTTATGSSPSTSIHSSDDEVVTIIGAHSHPPPSLGSRTRAAQNIEALGLDLTLPLPITTPIPASAQQQQQRGKLSRLAGFVKDTVAKRKGNAASVVSVLSPRRLREPDDEMSETDEGILFGVKRKHFKAQLNLSILTFGMTALISLVVLIFAAVMLVIGHTDTQSKTAYLAIITTIVAGWMPSPTTLVKHGNKK